MNKLKNDITVFFSKAISKLMGNSKSPIKAYDQPKTVFKPIINGRWTGLGISYGSYRDGESPHSDSITSEADILEDMLLLTRKGDIRWNLIRMYGADPASEQVLKVIRKHKLPVQVMQGAWLEGIKTQKENQQQINELIRLANEYSDIVVAVNLGNEIFVDWSWHKFHEHHVPLYLTWVKQVKAAVNVPVTLADDYNFWNRPWSQPIAEELDFIVLHAYAMWNSKTLEEAVSWTGDIFADIQRHHPNKQIVLGESGWATSSDHGNGDENQIIGEANETAQTVFYKDYYRWLKDHRIVSFYFEAFDEKWKGGEDKHEHIAEKNWGLFKSDRSPKDVLKPYYPTA
jgi:exo-beta-1,3-glucanase (GH17 family)